MLEFLGASFTGQFNGYEYVCKLIHPIHIVHNIKPKVSKKKIEKKPNKKLFNGRSEKTVQIRDKLIQLGYKKPFAEKMINTCKGLEKINEKYNAKDCIITAASIACAESSCNNGGSMIFGIKWDQYKNELGQLKSFMKRYTKHWYKYTEGKDFYGKNSKTHYCTDEASSGYPGYCPNGMRNFNKTKNYLNE